MKLSSSFKALIIFLLFINTTNYAQFLGGDGDGNSDIGLSNVVCAVVNTNPFSGGDADGSSNIRMANIVCPIINTNPFLGGDADGHSNIRMANVVCPVINTNPFLGGDADGHSNIRMANVVCPVINTNPFLGGDADGHSNIRMANIVCPIVNVNPYVGGASDGYSGLNLANVTRNECLSIVLPIELIHFTAVPNKNIVDLKWTTASEINNDYFTVEKTKDGEIYSIVTKVNGAGNSSSVLHYQTIDINPFPGVSYYRLKQTDFDGSYSYSNIVSVFFNTNDLFSLNLINNPLQSAQNLSFYMGGINEGELFIEIFDIIGNRIFSKTIPLSNTQEGIISIPLMRNLSAGTYLISATFEEKSYREKLVIY